jgi:hypothetical protein
MAEQLTRQRVAETATIHADLPLARVATQVDRGFELPTGLYVTMAALFFAAVAVLGIGLATRGLIVPMGIIAVFLAMFFAVPAQWVRMKPDHAGRAKSWSRFMAEGIQTYTGHCKGRDAAVQVLIMPVMIFCWGIGVVTIAVLTR